jgi:hypothetical protein
MSKQYSILTILRNSNISWDQGGRGGRNRENIQIKLSESVINQKE